MTIYHYRGFKSVIRWNSMTADMWFHHKVIYPSSKIRSDHVTGSLGGPCVSSQVMDLSCLTFATITSPPVCFKESNLGVTLLLFLTFRIKIQDFLYSSLYSRIVVLVESCIVIGHPHECKRLSKWLLINIASRFIISKICYLAEYFIFKVVNIWSSRNMPGYWSKSRFSCRKMSNLINWKNEGLKEIGKEGKF